MSTDLKTLRRRHFAEAAEMAARMETSARAAQLSQAEREGWRQACAWISDMLREASEIEETAAKMAGR